MYISVIGHLRDTKKLVDTIGILLNSLEGLALIVVVLVYI